MVFFPLCGTEIENDVIPSSQFPFLRLVECSIILAPYSSTFQSVIYVASNHFLEISNGSVADTEFELTTIQSLDRMLSSACHYVYLSEVWWDLSVWSLLASDWLFLRTDPAVFTVTSLTSGACIPECSLAAFVN